MTLQIKVHLKKIENGFKTIFNAIMPSYLTIKMLKKDFTVKTNKLLKLVEKVTYCNDFSDYLETNGIELVKKKAATLKKGVDEESLKVINMVIASAFPCDFYVCKGLVDETKLPYLKPINYDLKVDHCVAKYKKKYSFEYYIPEVFYYKHGLVLVNPKVIQYIKGKDFLDCGGFIGDSIAVLQEFEPKKIYSFEPDKFILDMLKSNLDTNKINNSIYELINTGVYDENCVIKSYCGKSATWNMTTIDSYVQDNNLNPSVIKMDIEGGGI
jgi:FkbM family methyltransferase